MQYSPPLRTSVALQKTTSRGFALRAAAAAAATEDAIHGRYSDDLLYVAIFGIVANLIILGACMTTLAFVRRRGASATQKPLLDPALESASACEEQLIAHRRRNDCAPSPMSPDVYRILAPAAAAASAAASVPTSATAAATAAQARPLPQNIPEVYASCQNMDVQAMMLSSTNLSQFFGKQQSVKNTTPRPGNNIIQWEMV